MAVAGMSAAMPALAPWQQRIYEHAVDALDNGRMGHALLVCGPALLGQREVAERLAWHLLGADRDQRAAQLLAAGTHPDYRLISFIPNKEGTRLRTEIVIEQMRELSEKLALTPQYGGAQVAIVDPADAINHAAANALLKTLEEPQPGRYLWLLSANPARLPATIRSRCQRLEFHLPPRDEALAWLQSQGHAAKAAGEALDAARGHPGLADAWLRDGGIALRREVAGDLAKLARGELAAVETAQRWTADDNAALRLRHAADLALAEAGGLTEPARMRKLATWFDTANRTRDLLQTTVRADLAVAELLLAWRGDNGREDRGGGNTQPRGRA
jgi:DNA polymerase III subunit delta'